MRGHALFRNAALVALAICYGTILLGGEVMASDAGLGCPDWPTCHGTFLPAWTGSTGIEYSHRLGALSLGIFVMLLFVAALLFERRRPTLVKLSAAAVGTVVAQAFLGGLVVRSQLSIALVLAHFAVATALLALLALLVLLAYLPVLPQRWIDWLREAGAERPTVGPVPERPTPANPTPGRATPSRTIPRDRSDAPGPSGLS